MAYSNICIYTRRNPPNCGSRVVDSSINSRSPELFDMLLILTGMCSDLTKILSRQFIVSTILSSMYAEESASKWKFNRHQVVNFFSCPEINYSNLQSFATKFLQSWDKRFIYEDDLKSNFGIIKYKPDVKEKYRNSLLHLCFRFDFSWQIQIQSISWFPHRNREMYADKQLRLHNRATITRAVFIVAHEAGRHVAIRELRSSASIKTNIAMSIWYQSTAHTPAATCSRNTHLLVCGTQLHSRMVFGDSRHGYIR